MACPKWNTPDPGDGHCCTGHLGLPEHDGQWTGATHLWRASLTQHHTIHHGQFVRCPSPVSPKHKLINPSNENGSSINLGGQQREHQYSGDTPFVYIPLPQSAYSYIGTSCNSSLYLRTTYSSCHVVTDFTYPPGTQVFSAWSSIIGYSSQTKVCVCVLGVGVGRDWFLCRKLGDQKSILFGSRLFQKQTAQVFRSSLLPCTSELAPELFATFS